MSFENSSRFKMESGSSAAAALRSRQRLDDKPERPQKLELLNNTPQEYINQYIPHNIIRYESLDDYVTSHYLLLREDFISSLRKGLRDYKQARMEGTVDKFRSMDVKMYRDVEVDFSKPPVNEHVKKTFSMYQTTIRLSNGVRVMDDFTLNKKFMMNGALLCLSDDEFEHNIYFATVKDRTLHENFTDNSQPNVVVIADFLFDSFETIPPTRGSSFQLMETQTFYEAYVHVLRTLKKLKELPFLQGIVKGDGSILTYPCYFKPTIQLVTQTTDDKNLTLSGDRNGHGWPQPHRLGLNDSQMKAYRLALTKDLALIQGPPGTGKTYVGLQIVRTIYENLKSMQKLSPILVICYTNHALDQFLEGMLKFINKSEILRMGRQSKNAALEDCLLRGKKDKFKKSQKNRRDIARLMRNVNNAQCSIDNFEYEKRREIEEIKAGIYIGTYFFIPYDTILMRFDHTLSGKLDPLLRKLSQTLRISKAVTIMRWLFPTMVPPERIHHWDELIMPDIEYYEKYHRFQYKPKYFETSGFMVALGRGRIKEFTNLLKQKITETRPMTLNEVTNLIKSCNDLNEVDLKQRWKFYMYFVNLINSSSQTKLESRINKYNELLETREHCRLEETKEIMRSQAVIGMTTTGAARYQKVLEEIGTPVVVVEEAAEVLEAHIISALSPKVQHLILIGDHKQLRPSCNNYTLESPPYNLGISLFERLVENGIPRETLDTQHRMRPEVSQFIRFIYPNLKDATQVEGRQGIAGLFTPVWFYNHKHPESVDSAGSSKQNNGESKMCAALCLYLIRHGYRASQITIITMYTGQARLLKNSMSNVIDTQFYNGAGDCKLIEEHLRSIRDGNIKTVDDYQGEENDIIILSLVRSADTGFTKVENRINVSLSRAKQGMFVLGNLNMMAERSDTSLWRNIVERATQEGLIGDYFKACCPYHPNVPVPIYKPEKFEDFNCNLLCELKWSHCEHRCGQKCHSQELHDRISCTQPCMRKICNDQRHRCPYPCFAQCPVDCRENVTSVFSKINGCQHSVDHFCHQIPATPGDIMALSGQVLRCVYNSYCDPEYCQLRNEGKPCFALCHADVTVDTCENCEANPRKIPCYQQYIYECIGSCPSQLDCGHKCAGTCSKCLSNGHKECKEKCGKKLEHCDHPCEAACRDCTRKGQHPECGYDCKKEMNCGHPCPSKCGCKRCVKGDHDQQRCQELCLQQKKCSHDCEDICGVCCKRGDHSRCGGIVTCGLLRQCGHQCRMPCHNKQINYEVTGGIDGEMKIPICPDERKCCVEPFKEISECTHEILKMCHQTVFTKAHRERYSKPDQPDSWIRYLQLTVCTETNRCFNGDRQGEPCFKVCGRQITSKCGRCDKSYEVECYLEGAVPCPNKHCFQTFKCGHLCEGACQKCFNKGKHVECKKDCPTILGCGHECIGKCNDKACRKDIHQDCDKKCEATLPYCRHPCPSKSCAKCAKFGHADCLVECSRFLPCSVKYGYHHKCKRPCHDMSESNWEDENCPAPTVCSVLVTDSADSTPCQHEIRRRCHQTLRSEDNLGVKSKECKSASTDYTCVNLADDRPCLALCTTVVDVPCAKCGEMTKSKCSNKISTKCQVECRTLLECGHNCTGNRHDCEDQGFHSTQCNKLCKKLKPCGHECISICHLGTECSPVCKENCLKRCDHGQLCSRRCMVECNFDHCEAKCQTSLECGHLCQRKIHTHCDISGHNRKCKVKCSQAQPCGHQCEAKCHFGSDHPDCCEDCLKTCDHGKKCKTRCDVAVCDFSHCDAPCNKPVLACGHDCAVDAHKCDGQHTCGRESQCGGSLPCTHTCKHVCTDCPASRSNKNEVTGLVEHKPCMSYCRIEMDCAHICMLKCHDEDPLGHKCKEKCPIKLPCGHSCTGECQKCKDKLQHEPCSYPKVMTLQCGHKWKGPCNTDPTEARCEKTCDRTLTCGHQCEAKCYQCSEPGSLKHRCSTKVDATSWKTRDGIPCGHYTVVKVNCSQSGRRHTREERCWKHCLLKCGHGEKCKKLCGELCDFGHDNSQDRCVRMKDVTHTQSLQCERRCDEPCSFIYPDDDNMDCEKEGICECKCKKEKVKCRSLKGLDCIFWCKGQSCPEDRSLITENQRLIKLECGHVFMSTRFDGLTGADLYCPDCHRPIMNNNKYLTITCQPKWKRENGAIKERQKARDKKKAEAEQKAATLAKKTEQKAAGQAEKAEQKAAAKAKKAEQKAARLKTEVDDKRAMETTDDNDGKGDSKKPPDHGGSKKPNSSSSSAAFAGASWERSTGAPQPPPWTNPEEDEEEKFYNITVDLFKKIESFE